MDKLKKKLAKLEKEFEKNPLATLRNARIMKRASKIQAKIEARERK